MNANQKLKELERQSFDANGRIQSWELRNEEKEMAKRLTYAYNDSSLEASASLEVVVFPTEPPKVYGPVKWRTFDAAGHLLSEYENGYQQQAWSYNEQGQHVGTTQWNGKEVERTQTLEYDANGRLASLSTFDAQGDLFFRSTYRYDKGGLLLGVETRYPSVGRVIKKRWVVRLRTP